MVTSSLSKLQKLLPELFTAKAMPGQPYLRLQLTPGYKALLPMPLVRESLLIPAVVVTPLPNMAESVIGLISSREQAFCIVDLPQLLLDIPLSAYIRQYSVIVVRLARQQEHYLGLAVQQIEGMTRVNPENLYHEIPANLPSSLAPFVSGYYLEQSDRLLVLDIPTLIDQAIRAQIL